MNRLPVKISLPKPCSEHWGNMKPMEQGRFCERCATPVIDFSKFTDQQIVAYLQQHSGKICGRFAVFQLNQEVYAVPVTSKKFLPSIMATAALFLGIYAKSDAQNLPVFFNSGEKNDEKNVSLKDVKVKTVPVKITSNLSSVSGIVIDSLTLEPIPYVFIQLKGALLKDVRLWDYADMNGEFRITLFDSMQPGDYTLEVPVSNNKPDILIRGTENYVRLYDSIPKLITITIGRYAIGLPSYDDPYRPDNPSVSKNTYYVNGVKVQDTLSIPRFEGSFEGEARKNPGYFLRGVWWRFKNLFRKPD